MKVPVLPIPAEQCTIIGPENRTLVKTGHWYQQR